MTASALIPDSTNSPPRQQPDGQAGGDHVVYFYQENDSLLEALCDFVGPALGADRAAIIIATKAHREGLQHRLTARGLNVQKASKRVGEEAYFFSSVRLSDGQFPWRREGSADPEGM